MNYIFFFYFEVLYERYIYKRIYMLCNINYASINIRICGVNMKDIYLCFKYYNCKFCPKNRQCLKIRKKRGNFKNGKSNNYIKEKLSNES